VKRLDKKSRMNREIHVRFCERLQGKFLLPTRPNWAWTQNHCALFCRSLGTLIGPTQSRENMIYEKEILDTVKLEFLSKALGQNYRFGVCSGIHIRNGQVFAETAWIKIGSIHSSDYIQIESNTNAAFEDEIDAFVISVLNRHSGGFLEPSNNYGDSSFAIEQEIVGVEVLARELFDGGSSESSSKSLFYDYALKFYSRDSSGFLLEAVRCQSDPKLKISYFDSYNAESTEFSGTYIVRKKITLNDEAKLFKP